MVDDRINQILEAVAATSYQLYLTDSKTNFRLSIATILPYKGKRKQEKPHHWEAIRQHLIDNWDAEVQYGIEADDRLGIEQYSNMDFHNPPLQPGNFSVSYKEEETVICSRDKDLHMIPGWHYTWPCGKQKEQYWFQDEVNALRCFYKQLLTGDATDNILGLHGVGSSSVLLKKLDEMETEQEMFSHVKEQYEKRFGSYWWKFLLENAQLLWILREEPNKPELGPEHEVYLRLDTLFIEGSEE